MVIEVIFYSIFFAVLWILALTIFLPLTILLKYSKTAGDVWFAFVFSKIICPLYPSKFKTARKNTFKRLEEQLERTNKRVPLELLEIGPGSGVNLPYYPENTNLTALDMNESFLAYFRENMKKYPRINDAKLIVGYAENMSSIRDGTIDAVVTSHVLCSVRDLKSVLNEVKRVLKPGGKFVFMEHGAFPDDERINSFLQNSIAPIWKIYGNGCHCNRNIAKFLNEVGFSDVYIENLSFPHLFLAARPNFSGIATK